MEDVLKGTGQKAGTPETSGELGSEQLDDVSGGWEFTKAWPNGVRGPASQLVITMEDVIVSS